MTTEKLKDKIESIDNTEINGFLWVKDVKKAFEEIKEEMCLCDFAIHGKCRTCRNIEEVTGWEDLKDE